MDKSQQYEEPMITMQVQPNEIIAINLAIGYFMRYCRLVSPVHPEACRLLTQYQLRMAEQLPPRPELRH